MEFSICLAEVWWIFFSLFSTWIPIYWQWWLKAQTCIRSAASLASSWLMVWLVALSTRLFRERLEDPCMLCTLKTGWWWVLLRTTVAHTGWNKDAFSVLCNDYIEKEHGCGCWCHLTLERLSSSSSSPFDSTVRILEHQVSQERVLCNRTIWRNGALQQHRVQLAGSATRSSGASAVLHIPLLHFYHGGHAYWERHHQPPSAW